MPHKFYILLLSQIIFVITRANHLNHEHIAHGGIDFIENKGQWRKNILFQADIPNGRLFIENDVLTYVFYAEEDLKKVNKHPHDLPPGGILVHGHCFKVKLKKANKNVQVEGRHELSGKYNYFLGNDPSKWAGNVKRYGELYFKEIWPNIDWRIYVKGEGLEYDFIIHPGGKYEDIELIYDGLDDLKVDNEVLKLTTSVNQLLESKPYTFQLLDGQKQRVESAFKLKNNLLKFYIKDNYDKSKKLIIDPRLIFSSYSGSIADNWGNTATYDEEGNLYTGGITFNGGPGFVTTTGAFDTTFNGGNTDLAITKYRFDGTTLIYSTYIGGGNTELPHSMIVNEDNELFIYGSTGSNNFPTAGTPFQSIFNGGNFFAASGIIYPTGSDIFVLRLSEDGSELMASTYIGGSNNDGLNQATSLEYNYADAYRGEIILDNQSNVVVASCTRSTNFDLSATPIQNTLLGNQDGVVFKMTPDLSTLLWSTYLGGTSDDVTYSLQTNNAGDLYVAGGTTSDTLFPITTWSFKDTFSGDVDGFIVCLDGNGTVMKHSTYLGTDMYDQAYFVQLDSAGSVYVLGQTTGNYTIDTADGEMQVYFQPDSRQFIHKLNDSLSKTDFSTTFGRTGSIFPNLVPSAFLVNTCGNIFISGWGGTLDGNNLRNSRTDGLDFTPGAYQINTDGGDFYFLVLTANATDILYATFFGDPTRNDHVDGGTSRFDKNGIIYQSVCASCQNSDNFPTTIDAWSRTNNSNNCNNGVIKFDFSELTAELDADIINICGTADVVFQNNSQGGITHKWFFGDGTDTTLNSTDSVIHTYDGVGTYTASLIITDSTTCTLQDTDMIVINVFPENLNADAYPDTFICPGQGVTIIGEGGATFLWEPSEFLSDSSSPEPFARPDTTTTYKLLVSDTNGCTDSAEVTISVLNGALALFDYQAPLKPLVSIDELIDFIDNSSFAETYFWDFGDGNSANGVEGGRHSFKEEGIYTVCLTVNNVTGCDSTYCLDIEVIKGRLHIPTAFSPNADGENDRYFLKGKGITNIEFKIFNRWGELVYISDDVNELFNPQKGWDGYFNGKLQGMDVFVYHYTVSFINGDEDSGKGDITLVH